MARTRMEPLDALMGRYAAAKRRCDELDRMSAKECFEELRKSDPEFCDELMDIASKHAARIDVDAIRRAVHAALRG